MFAGTCICVVAMLLLGFTRPFASIFTSSRSIAVRSRIITVLTTTDAPSRHAE